MPFVRHKVIRVLAALLLALFSARAVTYAQRHYSDAGHAMAHSHGKAPLLSRGDNSPPDAPVNRDDASSLRSSLVPLPAQVPVAVGSSKAPSPVLETLVSVPPDQRLRPPKA